METLVQVCYFSAYRNQVVIKCCFSDEILLSSDKTVAVIDGSGVLADPRGIDRAELIRLAKLRKPVCHFNTTKLSKEGFLVRLEDQDVKLPCMSRLFYFTTLP